MYSLRQGPLCILWGDKETCSLSKDAPEFKNFCMAFAQKMELSAFIVLNQEHGIVGYSGNDGFTPGVSVYEKTGDWLMTQTPGQGIAVLTADCLPVVFYDPEHQVVAIAHAGWKGAVKNIVGVVLRAMIQQYKTHPAQVHVFFGPAAKPCCYEVSPGFEKEIPAEYLSEELFVKRGGKLFFDNALLCQRMLEGVGVDPKNIRYDFNVCTMCNDTFHSARRDKGLARNITVVELNNVTVVSLDGSGVK